MAEADISVGSCDVVNAVIEQDPKHFGEAMKSKHRNQWQMAMTGELDALKANDVWEIVVPPGNAHVLHNIGSTRQRPTRKGTSSAFMDLGTVMLILVLLRRWKVPARHGDVPNAYVKGEKEEHLDIYMKVSKGMTV
uniref:Reverse transcriptase Ty1/copia-type domain-containing protein n=1 Tax=Peronospora matthiolae TaxID=2874970 RepID=A0AAV1UA53_9STRA